MAEQKPVDWEAIEREYRAGQLSVREIGRTHEISYETIRKRAKAKGWQRDLTDKVRAAVKDKVIRDVAREVDGAVDGTVDTVNAPEKDAATIEAAANRGAAVQGLHRKTLRRAHAVSAKLLDELEEATANRDEIEEAVEDDTKDAQGRVNWKRRAMMLRAVELPQRAQTAAALSVTLKNLITLERRAYNMDEPGEAADEKTPLSKLHSEISGKSFRPVE